jgi:tRNA 2-thiocytidine biosynthesis protein TtcA
VENIARSLQNVVPSHLCDTTLFDFAGLQPAAPVPGSGRIDAYEVL